jgi:RNA polymerase sigma-70 factor (ECF subfamily)
MAESTPHDLTLRAIAGDPAALDAVWCANRRWLGAVLLAHRPHGAELDDLLQETACAFLRGIRTLGDPAALPAWLRTLARNVALGAARRAAVRRRQEALPEPSGLVARDEAVARQRHDELLARIEQLAPEHREPLLLRCVHGFTQREIAACLELPETTVETRLARARRALRAALDHDATCTGRDRNR